MVDEEFRKAIDLDTEDGFFGRFPVAKRIIVEGPQKLETNKILLHNMQCLLSNMCNYGASHWSYEPGNEQNWDTYLTGSGTRTGCIKLATAFAEMTKALGKVTGKMTKPCAMVTDAPKYKAASHIIFDYKVFHPQETVQEAERLDERFSSLGGTRGDHAQWYRMISKPGVCDFTGKTCDRELGLRWNFGDHSVAVVDNFVYDPSFKFTGFRYSPETMNSTYVEWWVREEAEEGTWNKRKYVDVAGVKPDIYEYQVPGIQGRKGVTAVPGYGGLTFDRRKSENSSMF